MRAALIAGIYSTTQQHGAQIVVGVAMARS
jgi:hypothetical protein